MGKILKERIIPALAVFLWAILGAVIVSTFFLAVFFPWYTPIGFEDGGTALLFAPLLAGFIFGSLLTEQDMLVVAYASILMTILTVLIIFIVFVSPVLAGVAESLSFFEVWLIQRIAISSIFLFPLILLGSIVGRAFGEIVLPPEYVRKEIAKLREETKKWHEMLKAFGEKEKLRKTLEGGKKSEEEADK